MAIVMVMVVVTIVMVTAFPRECKQIVLEMRYRAERMLLNDTWTDLC